MASPDPDLYLVRIWRGAGRFRAAVRRVDEETLHCANSVAELVACLCGDSPPESDTASPPQRLAKHPAAMGGKNTP
jgi:hypothetical protein